MASRKDGDIGEFVYVLSGICFEYNDQYNYDIDEAGHVQQVFSDRTEAFRTWVRSEALAWSNEKVSSLYCWCANAQGVSFSEIVREALRREFTPADFAKWALKNLGAKKMNKEEQDLFVSGDLRVFNKVLEDMADIWPPMKCRSIKSYTELIKFFAHSTFYDMRQVKLDGEFKEGAYLYFEDAVRELEKLDE